MLTTRSLARPLLSAVFVSGGVDTLRNPEPRAQVAAPVVPTIADTVGLPADPNLLVRVNAAVQVGAGVLLAIGKLPRLAALALIGSTIPTTYAGHRFWEVDDKQERVQQQIHFLKNLGLIGGLIFAAVDTGGAPSVTWRARRRAGRAGTAVAKAVQTAAEHLPVG
jgi:putative oxidoreductase